METSNQPAPTMPRIGEKAPSFKAVTTTALRVQATLRERNTAGVLEWRIGP